MRELVINAFAHRSYLEHNAPVFLAIYDTRVEITSPGGFPRGQTAERAVAGYSKIRNEVLAKALNYMRFIEEWGSGLKRVNEVLGEYGVKKVVVDDAGFAVRMNVYRNNATGGEVVNPKHATENPTGEVVNVALNEGDVALNVASNKDDVSLNGKLVALVKAKPGINRKQLAEKLMVTTRTIDRLLVSVGSVVVRRGSKKTGGYYCKE